ncbi:MAG: glutamate-cysteine ligase family protein [Actinomycetota bacterium]
MPVPHRQFTVADAYRYVDESCLTTSRTGEVGLEIEWLVRDSSALGFPTEEDFAYHLTTLFPPVRPKAWLELRMLEALPRTGADAATVAAGAEYYDRFVARGRCPGDELLDAWTAGERALVPWQPEPVPV